MLGQGWAATPSPDTPGGSLVYRLRRGQAETRASAKKAARKVKPSAAPVVETVAVEVIEQPAPGVITDTEVEETRQVN
jgi:hypothetical protein